LPQFLEEIEGCVPALRRYARALTRDADRADDLVQDCIERAIRKRRLWSPTGPLRAWLFKILLNLYRNELRHRRRRGEQVPLDGMAVEPAIPAPQPGRIALNEMARAIASCRTSSARRSCWSSWMGPATKRLRASSAFRRER
jgi:RNA polymerase sigma-70 factor, ECF subfamily